MKSINMDISVYQSAGLESINKKLGTLVFNVDKTRVNIPGDDVKKVIVATNKMKFKGYVTFLKKLNAKLS